MLRELADQLEKEARKENFPARWRVGMRVRFLENRDWAWSRGQEAIITELSENCQDKAADEYQVFWTTPADPDRLSFQPVWWTTPADVEFVGEK